MKSQKKPKSLILRPSGLPTHQDCPRKWAAHTLAEVGEQYELAPKGIGAIIGDRCHAGAARMMEQKRKTGRWHVKEAVEEQLVELKKTIKSAPVLWDKVTRELGVAEVQIERMLWEFSRGVMPDAQPEHIELSMRCKISEGIVLSGQADYIEVHPGGVFIDDYKFGGQLSPHQAQLGAYLLLFESQPAFEGLEVTRLQLLHIKRVGIRAKVQPKVHAIPYSLEACWKAAQKQIDEIEREVALFKATGDPWSFNANPSSKLCTKTTCRAWGTAFCDQWTNIGDDDE